MRPAAAATKKPRENGAAPKMQVQGNPEDSRYCPMAQSETQGYASLDDMIYGVKLAILAYTDDNPAETISHYKGDMVLNGTYLAIEQVAGGPQRAMLPLTAILRSMGWTVDTVFSHTAFVDFQQVDTQGYICHNDKEIVISYRGTTGGLDWLTNVGFLRAVFEPEEDAEAKSAGTWVACGGCTASKPTAHEGFYNAFLQTIEDIEEYIMPLLEDGDKPRRLVIAGHSLGGALATAALSYLVDKFDFVDSPHEILYVTIGQPRFGDRKFRTWLSQELDDLKDADKINIARIVNDYDSVPTVPPSNFGFDHIEGLCILTDEADLLVDPDCTEANDAKDLDDPRELIEDHRPDHYLNLLLTHQKRISGR